MSQEKVESPPSVRSRVLIAAERVVDLARAETVDESLRGSVTHCLDMDRAYADLLAAVAFVLPRPRQIPSKATIWRRLDLVSIIRELLPSLPPRFTRNDVRAALAERGHTADPETLRQALWDTPDIAVGSPAHGKGSRPTIFIRNTPEGDES